MSSDEVITLDELRQRKVNYQLAFGSPAGQKLLDDLAWFCRADRSCFHSDPRIHAALEGRREVYLRIITHLDRTVEELAKIFGAVAITESTDD